MPDHHRGRRPRLRSVPSSSAPLRPSAHVAPRGFTLLEVLLSLAIIALIGSVLIGGSAQLLNDKPVSADDVFWKAVQEARKTALNSGREVRLTFLDDKDKDKGKAFIVDDGMAKQQFPVATGPTDNLEVTFLSTQKSTNSILVGGVLLETQATRVKFYPDGTCTPFRTQFFRNGAQHILSIDPWTCAPVLTPPDPNAPPGS